MSEKDSVFNCFRINVHLCVSLQSSLFGFGFGQSAEINIVLDGHDTRKKVEVPLENGKKDNYYLYFDGETVAGQVKTQLNVIRSKKEVSISYHLSCVH